jgi:hypothetical protein
MIDKRVSRRSDEPNGLPLKGGGARMARVAVDEATIYSKGA